MKIIVTGGAGFLGSHLCDRLIERGDNVYCIDNLITGSKDNIKHLLDNPNFHFIEADIVKETEWIPDYPKGTSFFEAAQVRDDKVDQIYHLASPASPNKNNPKSYISFPFETMDINTVGTSVACGFAVKNNARLLFASTSEIYGDPLEHPQKETYRGNVSTIGPRSVYDEAKRFGETIVSSFVRNKGMDGGIIRIFNTYGERMADDGRVVIEFIKAALENKPLPIFGDGTQTRSFCYVSDLVEGIMLAMDKGIKGEVYNLGNPNEFSILELAEKVKALTGASSEIKTAESLPEDDPKKRCPDITKARTELGWEPKVNLEEGLRKLIEYLKTNPT